MNACVPCQELGEQTIVFGSEGWATEVVIHINLTSPLKISTIQDENTLWCAMRTKCTNPMGDTTLSCPRFGVFLMAAIRFHQWSSVRSSFYRYQLERWTVEYVVLLSYLTAVVKSLCQVRSGLAVVAYRPVRFLMLCHSLMLTVGPL